MKTFRCSFSLKSEETEQEQTSLRLKRVDTEHKLNPAVPRGVPGVGPDCGPSPSPRCAPGLSPQPLPRQRRGALQSPSEGKHRCQRTASETPGSLRTHHRGAEVPAALHSPSNPSNPVPGPPVPPGPPLPAPAPRAAQSPRACPASLSNLTRQRSLASPAAPAAIGHTRGR